MLVSKWSAAFALHGTRSLSPLSPLLSDAGRSPITKSAARAPTSVKEMGRLGAKDARPLGSGGGYAPPKDRGEAGGNKIGRKFLRGLRAF